MKSRLETILGKLLIGKRITMSLTQNKTADLWRSFMPRKNEIKNSIGTDLYSIQIYDSSYFANFDPNKEFVKWAAIEVQDTDWIPSEMETITIPKGLYSVFLHKGGANEGYKTFQYIFETWLPNSDYVLDERPHFEKLGDKYKNGDPDSEEEFWIPIRYKR
ncbi:GyrI-like domain-containing protein [Leptospira adleri]|uniref:GyrI-like domain-containing protein n=1 Tax=Leptospira adleri TaxID=2023186 RepID=UPI0010839AE7|nr:GyrI-like domain-containing protein [Leptospira adleri]TGM53121.1 AraC family transcriptional regulator [Leptospira adleri]